MSYQVAVKDNKLVITIDMNWAGVESKSGKTMVIASTNGNQAVALPDGKQFKLGLNAYRDK